MVHGIVHDHGGHLHLITTPGQGTRFGLWLPLSAPAHSSVAPSLAAAGRDIRLRGRVLLVEDDTMVGDFLAERLVSWGLEVRLERAAPAAAAWLEDPANDVDLLVTDQTMPSMTGLQLAAHAHTRRPALAILLVSGNADPFDTQELARCGITTALRKPIDVDEFHTVLRRLLPAS
jgi:DNA-binding NtrC family response regulator